MSERSYQERPCKKCGEIFSKRACPGCANRIAKAYYQKNKDVILVKEKAYRESNPELREKTKLRMRERVKSDPAKFYEAKKLRNLANPEIGKAQRARKKLRLLENPEKLAEFRAKHALYQRLNYEKNRARREKYNAENSAKIVAKIKQWRALNPDAVALHAKNRRARKKGASGSISPGLREKLLKLQKGKCACCGLPLGENFHFDHIVPLSKGGSNDDSNIQLMRSICNTQKSDKDPIVFMQQRGFLL